MFFDVYEVIESCLGLVCSYMESTLSSGSSGTQSDPIYDTYGQNFWMLVWRDTAEPHVMNT